MVATAVVIPVVFLTGNAANATTTTKAPATTAAPTTAAPTTAAPTTTTPATTTTTMSEEELDGLCEVQWGEGGEKGISTDTKCAMHVASHCKPPPPPSAYFPERTSCGSPNGWNDGTNCDVPNNIEECGWDGGDCCVEFVSCSDKDGDSNSTLCDCLDPNYVSTRTMSEEVSPDDEPRILINARNNPINVQKYVQNRNNHHSDDDHSNEWCESKIDFVKSECEANVGNRNLLSSWCIHNLDALCTSEVTGLQQHPVTTSSDEKPENIVSATEKWFNNTLTNGPYAELCKKHLNPKVKLHITINDTNVGDIEVTLSRWTHPKTVNNFLGITTGMMKVLINNKLFDKFFFLIIII